MLSWLKRIFGGKPDADATDDETPGPPDSPVPPDSEAQTVSDPALGYYVDAAAMMLPTYIVPGHGFVVLRDFQCDRILLDGVDIGDFADRDHPHFKGSFRGFFNVPPGPHTVVTEYKGQRSQWSFELAPNAAVVRRSDWGRGGLVEDDLDTESRYRDLARSGSMLQAGALRPWPLPSVFFQSAPQHVTIDGRTVPTAASRAFFGVTGLAPGRHQLRVGEFDVQLGMELDSRPLLSCSAKGVEVLEPQMAAMLIKVLMMRAPKESLWPLSALTPLEQHITNAQDNLAHVANILAQATGQATGQPRQFGDADLERLRRAFSQLQADYDEHNLREYAEVLRHHYILDREMAKQADYFGRYAAEVLRHVEALPRLTAGQAMTHLRYLAEDMQDTGVAALATIGRKLGAALDKASSSAPGSGE